MPPRARKQWCELCKKSFPSFHAFAGHMNLHRGKRKQKKQSRGGCAPAGGYGLRERRHSAWLLCDSGEDEYLTPVPKTECQLCFKVFASHQALLMHMRGHARHERKVVANEASRESNGYCDHNVAVSTPVLVTYGIEEVNAARVLMMISGHSGMESASEHCDKGFEMDGDLAYCVQKSEMELDYPGHGQTGDAELMTLESPSSDVKLKFSSLSQVLKTTATHDCKLCGKVFTSNKGLAGHKNFHRVRDHGKVAAAPKSAVSQTGRQLLGVDSQLLYLNLPALTLSDKNYSSRSPKSEHNPCTSGLLTGRELGVV